ncbi:MAG: hypothetical protein ACJASM_003106 [Salibacteraceae bacterium]|jgi:hypothetical protein
MNEDNEKLNRNLRNGLATLYSQVESFIWLSKALTLSGSLPPLRGWATSPDILLKLHEYIRLNRPKLIVECGSGASTIVIADALRQVGSGKLISLEHSDKYGAQTRGRLQCEKLLPYVDVRISSLKPWDGTHLSDEDETFWYDDNDLSDIDGVQLLLVDGPPGKTCKYARYPAMEAFHSKLTQNAQVWMDDTIRREEVDICSQWAEKFEFEQGTFAFEKGLIVLNRKGVKPLEDASFLNTGKSKPLAEFDFSSGKRQRG